VALDKIKRRLASDQGFTLIELLIVIIILGILVAIAVPSYLTFRSKAQTAAAEANVRSAVPAAESYYQDVNGGNGTYNNLKRSTLIAEAPGVDPNIKAVALNNNLGYCIEDTQGASTYDYIGGSATPANGYALATIEAGTCSAADGGTAALTT
jgi:type IV pilus assembly protein PilA